jgi:hypothetical protein
LLMPMNPLGSLIIVVRLWIATENFVHKIREYPIDSHFDCFKRLYSIFSARRNVTIHPAIMSVYEKYGIRRHPVDHPPGGIGLHPGDQPLRGGSGAIQGINPPGGGQTPSWGGNHSGAIKRPPGWGATTLGSLAPLVERPRVARLLGDLHPYPEEQPSSGNLRPKG